MQPADKLVEKKVGEEFTSTGMWWIPRPPHPENPKTKSYGVFTYSEGKFRLCTIGPLEFGETENKAINNFITRGFSPATTIWGMLTSGEFVTLFDCRRMHYATGFSMVVYEASTVLVNKSALWFENAEDVVFDELKLRYTHLDAWVSVSGLSMLRPEDCRGAAKGSQTFSIKPFFTLQTIDIGDYTLSLQVSWHIQVGATQKSKIKDRHTLAYDNDNFILIKPKEGKITVAATRELIKLIWNFLSLMMGGPTYVQTIEGVIKKSNKDLDIDFINLFERIRIPPRIEELQRERMLFSHQKIKPIFGDVFKKMLVKEMRPVYSQFFAELHNPPFYAEDEFIGAVRAIEVFHRRAVGGDYVAKDDYRGWDDRLKKLVDKLVQECDFATLKPEDKQALKQSLYQKLTYGYQYSLQRRLKELIRVLEPDSEHPKNVFLKLFVNKDANADVRDAFINRMRKTRNYYIHYDDEDKEEAITDTIELTRAAAKLKVLLYMLLFNYVGIPQKEIDEAMATHSSSLWHKFGYLRAK